MHETLVHVGLTAFGLVLFWVAGRTLWHAGRGPYVVDVGDAGLVDEIDDRITEKPKKADTK